MESEYNKQRSEYEAAAQKIPQSYQTQANDLAAQYERQKKIFNEQAAANGLNTGTGSQAALAQNAGYQKAYAQLRTAQADAETEAARRMQDLETAYKAQVAQAMGENDYQRAKALMDEYNNNYSRQLQQAQTMAQYGDFSGYSNLYGQGAADNMSVEYQRQRAEEDAKNRAQWGDFSGYATLYGGETAAQMAALWNAQNPDLAYNTGRISAEQYRTMTGSYPAGYGTAYGGYTGSGGTAEPDSAETAGSSGMSPTALKEYLTYLMNQRSGRGAGTVTASSANIGRNTRVVA